MKLLTLVAGLFMLCSVSSFAAVNDDNRCFEMRTYHVPDGKMEDLHNRFRKHTNKLFQKHGITMVGYWVEVDKENKPLNRLRFILAYPDREAREKRWNAFATDPEWLKAHKESEANGKLVEKVEQIFMTPTDYTVPIQPAKKSPPRIFELRTYTTTPGNLGNLNARFRDHTIKLFSKHGMEHIGYWTPMKGEKGADDTLIYILAHKSREAGAASFKTFREDPDWVTARKASEQKAGGSLTVPDGVKSTFLIPTDYSPTQ